MAIISPDAQVSRPAVDFERLQRLGRELLEAIGEDPDRPGLEDTPRRWAGWWREFVEYDAGNTDALFESFGAGQMVTVSGIRVWTVCEHHLLPFWCDVAIGYVARDQVLGLSKFARVAHQFAHRLQVQERLVEEIADEIERLTGSPDVAVLARGEHLCMTSRGIRTPGVMSSSSLRGAFTVESATASQFFQMIRGT